MMPMLGEMPYITVTSVPAMAGEGRAQCKGQHVYAVNIDSGKFRGFEVFSSPEDRLARIGVMKESNLMPGSRPMQ